MSPGATLPHPATAPTRGEGDRPARRWRQGFGSLSPRAGAARESGERAIGAVAPALTLALAACGPSTNPATEPTAPPRGILLISIDTLRADHVSAYGYERPTTPRIDSLAGRGVLFEHAFSTTSWTLPAHLSMLTGLGIDAHGACDDRLWDRVDEAGERVPPPLRGTFVSEVLHEAGWATAGFYTWKYLDDTFGFGPGFDVWERLGHDFFSHPEIGAEFLRLRRADDVEGMKALAAQYPDLLDSARVTSPETIERAKTWLSEHMAQNPAQPFFLFVHLFDVHDPYLPPEGFDRFGDPDYRGPIDGRRITSPDSPVRGDMPAADLERLVSLYDGGILWVDSEVGRLLDHVDQLDLTHDTLVVVTSDHGEEFYEHGQKVHRRQLFVESTRVPLLMRWPAALPAGQKIDESVGLIDLAPTLLAAAGLRSPSPMEGRDLGPLARGHPRSTQRAPTYSSLLLRFEEGRWIERQIGFVDGHEHELLSFLPDGSWTGTLFDLRRDPREHQGQGFGPEDERGQRVLERLDRLQRVGLALREGLPSRGADLPSLSELDKSQLAAMGYVGVSEERASSSDAARVCTRGCVWD